MTMELTYQLPTIIHVLKSSATDHANDLIAVGGDRSLDVLQISNTGIRPLANFNIGLPITAVTWSNKSVSPSSNANWSIELVAAGDDRRLYLLNKKADNEESIFPFGGGLTGHHDRINSLSFCGGQGADSTRYVATAANDKMLMVWDLYPASSCDVSPSRPQPTAYVIPFSHPLASVTAHRLSSKEFLVADARGTVFVIDWRSDPTDKNRPDLRHSSLIELQNPQIVLRSIHGKPMKGVTSVAWCADSTDLIGATFDSKLCFWDMSNLRGGMPAITIETFPRGARQFRWSNTHPDYFAVSRHSSTENAVIHVRNINYVHAPPAVIDFPQPFTVQDFDFLTIQGNLLIVVGTGHIIRVVIVGRES